jgi:hypothetical protein
MNNYYLQMGTTQILQPQGLSVEEVSGLCRMINEIPVVFVHPFSGCECFTTVEFVRSQAANGSPRSSSSVLRLRMYRHGRIHPFSGCERVATVEFIRSQAANVSPRSNSSVLRLRTGRHGRVHPFSKKTKQFLCKIFK